MTVCNVWAIACHNKEDISVLMSEIVWCIEELVIDRFRREWFANIKIMQQEINQLFDCFAEVKENPKFVSANHIDKVLK